MLPVTFPLGSMRFSGSSLGACYRILARCRKSNSELDGDSLFVWLCNGGGDRVQESITTVSGEFAFLGLNSGSFILQIFRSIRCPEPLLLLWMSDYF